MFLNMDLIPLGRNTYIDRVKAYLPTASQDDFLGNAKKPQVCMKYKRNGVITIIGGASVGKSVTAKKIFAWYKLPNFYGNKYPRPAIIFDYQGVDHRLIVKPNGSKGNNPFPLIYGVEKPQGFGKDKLINYTPYYLMDELGGDSNYDDTPLGYTLNDLDYEDWSSLRVLDASMDSLKELVELNSKLAENPEDFFDEFKRFNPQGTKAVSDTLLKFEEKITQSEKMHLRKALRKLIVGKVVTNQDKKVDFLKDLEDDKIVIINFHEDEQYSRLYMGLIARELYKWSKKRNQQYGFKKLNPILLLEEAQIALDKNDTTMDLGSNIWVRNFLKQGFKFQNLLILVTQAITEINQVIRNHAVKQEVILSNIVSSDLNYFAKNWRREVIEVIKTLDWENRELALISNGGNYIETFISNNSMTQIHLR